MLSVLFRLVLSANFVLSVFASVRAVAAEKVERPRTDIHGDPLPPGAVARLGTIRLHKHYGFSNLAFSPDSSVVVSNRFGFVFWDRSTGLVRGSLDLESLADPFDRYAFTPDGKCVISTDKQGNFSFKITGVIHVEEIHFWDVESGEELLRINVPGATISALAISPDGKLVACGDEKGIVHLWDVVEGKWKSAIPGPKKSIHSLAFTPDGTGIAIQSHDDNHEIEHHVRLIDVVSGEILFQFMIERPGRIALARDGHTVATFSASDGLCLWDTSTGTKRQLSPYDKEKWYEITFAPDGKTLLAADRYGSLVQFWNVETGKRIRQVPLPGLDHDTNGVILSPDGRTLASSYGSDGDLLFLWDADTGKRLLDYPSHFRPPDQIAFSPDGKVLMSQNWRDGIFRWDVKSSRLLSRTRIQFTVPSDEREYPTVYRFAPEGNRAVIVEGKNVHLHDTRSGKIIHLFRGHEKNVTFADFSPAGETLATASHDGTVRLWETASGKLARVLDHRKWTKKVCWVLFTPDGKKLATGSWPQLRVDLWDAATGKHLAMMEGKSEEEDDGIRDAVWNCCFSADGKFVYSTNNRKFVVWDLEGRRRVFPLSMKNSEDGLVESFRPLSVSPDGRLILRFGDGDSLQIWESASHRLIHQFPEWEYSTAAFSPDSRRLAVGCNENASILLWDLVSLFRSSHLAAEARSAPWDDLASIDAVLAYRTIGQLATDERTAIGLFTKHLKPVPSATPEQLAALLKDLDSSTFEVRERAASQFAELRQGAVPFLERVVKGKTHSVEVRRQARAVLERIQPGSREWLRDIRALQALEYLGSPEARRLLSRLAEGNPEARLTVEAKAACARLAGHESRGP